MIIDDKTRDEKLQYNVNTEAAKNRPYHLEKSINTNILQQRNIAF